MLQFVVVNTKQARVDKGVEQHIIARFTKMLEVEPIPHLPYWLKKEIEKGEDDKALSITIKLNSDSDSPWYGRIQLADQERDKDCHTIAQKSFVTSVKRHLLTKNHPLLMASSDAEKHSKILKNFWKAVENVFVDKQSDVASVVFKSNGLEFFHAIFAPMLYKLAGNKSYKVDDFKRCLDSVHGSIQNSEIMLPEYWQSGNDASGLNNAATTKLAAEFRRALSEVNDDDDVQV